jgi:hypothetical protein
MFVRTVALSLAAALLGSAAQAQPASEAHDRASILGMTGSFEATFDFRETTALQAGYKPYPGKKLGGEEVVRAIEDKPGKIVLQHMLVAVIDGKPVVIKHWRQDWTYEPKAVLAYTAMGQWKLQPVPEAERKGAWSQTVWGTDDSPRYGAVGRWTYDNGVTQWLSSYTRRPLPRRDATRHPPYDHLEGTNRHVLTPTGWVQEEVNEKVGVKDGKPIGYVRETVTNSYDRFDKFPVAAADDYWAKTGAYWTQVRAAWDRAIGKSDGVAVPEDAEMGSVTGERLMDLADEINDGKTATPAATAKAEAIISHPSAPAAVASR